ncbi:hypothetical protein C8Q77DRAFT_1068615 [Trametes polyzona]|nr:hypothetical protein C8Q77DRAFT_1068615 [Trametes polyzona]
MHHFCAICSSPFLLDSHSATTEFETIVTTCGHIFHRDCIQKLVVSGRMTCHSCSAPLQENNKFTKIILTYEEGRYDRDLLEHVKSVTASERIALGEQVYSESIDRLERTYELLSGQHLFNRLQVNELRRQTMWLDAQWAVYESRLKAIEQGAANSEAEHLSLRVK